MIQVSSSAFAEAFGITPQAARKAFKAASQGKPWRGLPLPVVPVTGKRGGAGGVVYALDTDAACPDLRALLNLPSAPVETALEAPFERAVDAPRTPVGPVDAAALKIMQDCLRVFAPILDHPPRSAERAAAFRNVAAVPQVIGGKVNRVSQSTLRDWVRAVESRGDAALLPRARVDKGSKRTLISKAWDDGIGLDEETRAKIATKLEATAKGMIVKAGSATRTILRVCSAELQRLSVEAGCTAPRGKLRSLCKLNWRWAAPFADRMRVVHDYDRDHKRYSDKHEARVSRRLADLPMQVVYGDVHHVDIIVAPLAEPVRVKLIAWLCGATHYMHVTPVLVDGRKSIRQEDIAGSLFNLTQHPCGGMPRTLYLDNGGEYGALEEAAARFATLAEGGAGLRIIKARPYSPESKGALEGAFGIIKEVFFRALAGFIGGDRMKSPTKSKGKPVDPYPHGLPRLVEDILQAVDSYNGTPQDGRLGGLSPRAKLQQMIDVTGWDGPQTGQARTCSTWSSAGKSGATCAMARCRSATGPTAAPSSRSLSGNGRSPSWSRFATRKARPSSSATVSCIASIPKASGRQMRQAHGGRASLPGCSVNRSQGAAPAPICRWTCRGCWRGRRTATRSGTTPRPNGASGSWTRPASLAGR